MTLDARRVFRVNLAALPEGAKVDGALVIRGWLALDPDVSVRLSESPEEGRRAYTNLREHVERPEPAEKERRIEPYEAEKLLEDAVAAITKTRYRVNVGGEIWSVDQYLGPFEGLWLASVKLDPEDTFVKPKWIGAEVTGMPDYEELAMARAGKPPT